MAPTTDQIPKDQPKVAQAAAPVATLSSKVDPWPHYVMTAACAGASAYSYFSMNNPRYAAIAAAGAAAYYYAGHSVVTGNPRFGYDLGTVTSLGLVAAAGPKAYHSGEAYSTALTALGGISSVANLIKSYQFRTGKPHEMHNQ